MRMLLGHIYSEGFSAAHSGRGLHTVFRRLVQVVFQDQYRFMKLHPTVGVSIIESHSQLRRAPCEGMEAQGGTDALVRLQLDALSRIRASLDGQSRRVYSARALAYELKGIDC